MESILNLHSSYGLPLCVSGITHRLALPAEMADHDRRREAMKRKRSQARRRFHATQQMGTQGNSERVLEEVKEGDLAGDLDTFSSSSLCSSAAKAA